MRETGDHRAVILCFDSRGSDMNALYPSVWAVRLLATLQFRDSKKLISEMLGFERISRFLIRNHTRYARSRCISYKLRCFSDGIAQNQS